MPASPWPRALALVGMSLCAVVGTVHGDDQPSPTGNPMAYILEPTLSPDRWKNYHPVMSPTEVQHMSGAVPTMPPDRDCVRDATRSMCGCQEMLDACQEEAYRCDVAVEESGKMLPSAERLNHVSKFSHPLLNTLQRRQRLRRQRPEGTCSACFRRLINHRPGPGLPEGAPGASFLQQQPLSEAYQGPVVGFTPAEVGWRIDGNAPEYTAPSSSGQGAKAPPLSLGNCNVLQTQVLGDCLSYFWTCDQNRERIQLKIRNLNAQTAWIDSHPGTRPGLFAGGE